MVGGVVRCGAVRCGAVLRREDKLGMKWMEEEREGGRDGKWMIDLPTEGRYETLETMRG
jgi:hypothetical protein